MKVLQLTYKHWGMNKYYFKYLVIRRIRVLYMKDLNLKALKSYDDNDDPPTASG